MKRRCFIRALYHSIRRFRDQERVPIAVYAFVACDSEAGKPDLHDLRIVLRLSSEDNDFRLMVDKLAPLHLTIATAVTIDTDEKGLSWLSQQ